MKKENNNDIDIQACAPMDCTGLIPTLPQSVAELESYEDLYPFEPPVVDEKEDKERKC